MGEGTITVLVLINVTGLAGREVEEPAGCTLCAWPEREKES